MRWVHLLIFLQLAACGGGGGGGGDGGAGPSNTTPTISDLDFHPSGALLNSSGGQVTVNGNFAFTDRDGNLSTATLQITDNSGQTVATQTIDIVGAAGVTSGRLDGSVVVPTTILGDFTFEVFVTDGAGARSNALAGVFRIVEPAWRSLAPMPTERRSFATAVLDERVYVLGGGDESAPVIPRPPVTTVEIYDPATEVWTTGPSMLVAVSEHMAASVGGKVYVIGGVPDVGIASTAVQEFDPTTQQWALKTPMPDARYAAAVSVHGDRIYIAGGRGAGVNLNSLLWYEPGSDTWGAGTPMSESREGAAGATLNNRFVVYGGYTSMHVPDGGYRRLVELYDPAMDIWAFGTDGSPRRDAGTAVHGGLMFAFGGNNTARSLDWNQAYDSAPDQWLGKLYMPENLGYVRAETIGDRIFVFSNRHTLEYTPGNDLL
jgi:hypothetical protein